MRADWEKALGYEIWVGHSRRLQLRILASGFLVFIWVRRENGAWLLKGLNPLLFLGEPCIVHVRFCSIMQRPLVHNRNQYAIISSMQKPSCDVEHATGEANYNASIEKSHAEGYIVKGEL